MGLESKSLGTKNSPPQYWHSSISVFPTMKLGPGGGGGVPPLLRWLSAVPIHPCSPPLAISNPPHSAPTQSVDSPNPSHPRAEDSLLKR